MAGRIDEEGKFVDHTTKSETPTAVDLAAIAARGNAQALRRYWTSGEGGRLVRWGTPGDFDRCVRRVRKYMTTDQAEGFCAERHHDATGKWPGED